MGNQDGRYPESLDELTEKKYLRTLPWDPILEASDKWTLVAPPAEVKGSVYDLKSSAEGSDRSGRPFNTL